MFLIATKFISRQHQKFSFSHTRYTPTSTTGRDDVARNEGTDLSHGGSSIDLGLRPSTCSDEKAMIFFSKQGR
jgi:hypothetical protein